MKPPRPIFNENQFEAYRRLGYKALAKTIQDLETKNGVKLKDLPLKDLVEDLISKVVKKDTGAAMKTLEELQEKLQSLEKEIAETKKRLPAHSVKPPVMMDLLALEDQYDEILKEIEKLKK